MDAGRLWTALDGAGRTGGPADGAEDGGGAGARSNAPSIARSVGRTIASLIIFAALASLRLSGQSTKPGQQAAADRALFDELGPLTRRSAERK